MANYNYLYKYKKLQTQHKLTKDMNEEIGGMLHEHVLILIWTIIEMFIFLFIIFIMIYNYCRMTAVGDQLIESSKI